MTEYKCTSCGMVGEADEWIYEHGGYDEFYIICPNCGGEACEYCEDEDEEESEEDTL